LSQLLWFSLLPALEISLSFIPCRYELPVLDIACLLIRDRSHFCRSDLISSYLDSLRWKVKVAAENLALIITLSEKNFLRHALKSEAQMGANVALVLARESAKLVNLI